MKLSHSKKVKLAKQMAKRGSRNPFGSDGWKNRREGVLKKNLREQL